MLSFLDHYPYENEPSGERIHELDGFAALGQTATMSVSLLTELENRTIFVDSIDLVDGSNVIPSSCMQLYVVKCWEQAGVGIYQRESMTVRELLLKDDEQSLCDGYSRRLRHWKHLIKPFSMYDAPDVRLVGGVKTCLQKGLPKQLWLTVEVPAHVAAGEYQGVLNFSGDLKARLPVRLTVHPIALTQLRQDRLIWYRASLDWRSRQHYVAPEVMYQQLRDIFAHGFNSISLWDSKTRLVQKALDMLNEIGFSGNVVFMQPYPERIDRLRLGQLTPVYYVSDELDVKLDYATEDPALQIDRHRQNWTKAKQAGVKTITSLLTAEFIDRLTNANDIGHCPDIVSLFMPTARDSLFCQAELPSPQRLPTYFYWHAHMEKPNVHRVLAGLYLWKSGVDGISPFCYQFMPMYPFSPFNDFDEWIPGLHVGGEKGAFKDQMSTYPAKRGAISTVQWEGLREGIIDLRYLTTLHDALKRYESAGISSAEVAAIYERVERFLKRIDLRNIDVLSHTDMEPYETVSPREYHQFRQQMAMDILRINELLAKSQTAAASEAAAGA